MNHRFCFVVTAAFCLSATAAHGQAAALEHTRSGLLAQDQGQTLEVTALRADALRIRMWQGSAQPEDASWAILPAALHSRDSVIAEPQGFRTTQLHVSLGAHLTLTVTDNQGNILQQDAEPQLRRNQSFRVYKQRSSDDHFFGLGDEPGPLDRSGEAFALWNTDQFGWQESTNPLYKSIPFFINLRAGRAVGVLLNNTYRSFFDFGREHEHEYSFGAEDGACDYVLLYGPTPRQVLADYAWLTGPTPLPPVWSLGFQQSRYSYSPESQLTDVEHRLRADRIPADVLWLDIDFQKNNMPFTVDPERFPAFPQLVKNLRDDHFHLVVITDLHIADQPGIGYAPYDSGVAGDHFVKLPDGSTYVGVVWPGKAVFPDFSQQKTQGWWGALYKDFIKDGVAGFWNDMNEPAVFNTPTKTMPDNVQGRIERPGFRTRTTTQSELHNVFGMLNSEGTYDGMLAARPNERPFVMTRASFAGGQRYAVTWTGDNSATWNHLRMTTPQLLNLGLSGFSMAGADVGGFAGSPPPDLLTKWLELAAFQPIDRDHSAKGTRLHEVWVDGPEQEAIRRRFIEERYRLMPYLYTAAEQTSRDGVPMMRPLFVDFPDAGTDGQPLGLDAGGSEYLLGTDLLIAPNPSPEEIAPYEVHLPPGTWFDYWSGKVYERRQKNQTLDLEQRDQLGAGERLMITPQLDTLPVYVRGGSIIPVEPLVQSTDETPSGPLTLRIYPATDPAAPCEGELYADDGHSFDYRRGTFARINVSCKRQQDGSLDITIAAQSGSLTPWWKSYRLEIYGWAPTKSRAADRASQTLQLSGNAWTMTIPVIRDGQVLHLR